MAASSLATIIAAIETRLDTISSLRSIGVSPDQITPPMAMVEVPDIPDYHLTMKRGYAQYDFKVRIFVSAGYTRTGHTLLAEYADVTGSKSVIAAIEGDRTLAGAVETCHVVSFSNLGLREVGAISYLAGEFALAVVGQGL